MLPCLYKSDKSVLTVCLSFLQREMCYNSIFMITTSSISKMRCLRHILFLIEMQYQEEQRLAQRQDQRTDAPSPNPFINKSIGFFGYTLRPMPG